MDSDDSNRSRNRQPARHLVLAATLAGAGLAAVGTLDTRPVGPSSGHLQVEQIPGHCVEAPAVAGLAAGATGYPHSTSWTSWRHCQYLHPSTP